MTHLIRLATLAAMLLGAPPAQALTNSAASLSWEPTSDPTIRYELRWKHFASQWAWEPIASNLDSTRGTYAQTFTPLPETTGDRGACWDARAVRGGLASPWLSDTNQQVCTQMPVGLPSPVPVPPLPTPTLVPVPASPAATITQSGDTITIQCDRSRFTRMKTTGRGTKRTITCLK